MAHLANHDELIRNSSEHSKAYLILHCVAQQRAFDGVPGLRDELVAMMPTPEGALVLHIGEVMIPIRTRRCVRSTGCEREEGETSGMK